MSELALQLIAKEKQEKTGMLDLGKCGLTSIPEELFELTWLEELSLSNKIWNVDKSKLVESFNNGEYNNFFNCILSEKFQELSSLIKLNISGDQGKSFFFQDASVLGKIYKLLILELSYCSIKNYNFLENLTSLISLDLSYNQVRDINILGKLNNLQTLYLSGSHISNVSFLKNLINIQTLYLSSNMISDISVLENLIKLKILHLSVNQIKNYNSIKKLKDLKTLYLSINSITDIGFIEKLTALQTLSLGDNKIRDLSILKNLTKLETLDLEWNKIDEISFLEKLNCLQLLNLRGNQIINIQILKNLVNLKSLDLSGNKINDVKIIENLTNLKTLFLNQNKISRIHNIENLSSLKHLFLGGNMIHDIIFIEKLTNLYSLDISNNQISDINPIKKLTHLQFLNLRDNEISDISPLLPLLKKGLPISFDKSDEKILIGKNPLSKPPLEIAKQGRDAVLNYFEQLKDEKDYLFEAKVLLVGEERAGKSTIANALIDPDFKIDFNKKTTHGIDILKWTIPKIKSKTSNDFHFNIWDFGGQEIYHTTHQFFLTKRSLYLFITESRKDLRYDDFYYWLNIISSLAGDSPVILVQNKIDQNHKNQNIDEYRKRFPQIADELQQMSCNTEHEDWTGIYYPKLEILKENIYKILKDKKLPGVGDELPKAWIDIRKEINKLQNQNINFIAQSKYFEICKDNGLDRKQALHLSDYFHDLGVFLHFRDDIQLKNIIFINHKWVTKAIYNVFDNKKVKDAHGKFTDEDLMTIWDEPEFRDRQPELLNLMKSPKFKICYQHQYQYYLAPQLFDDKPLSYEWQTNENNLRFRYQYEFMPKGILSQLIVLMHQYIHQNTYWLHGVLFNYKNSQAIVKENRFSKNNLITIQVTGEAKQNLLTLIASNIEEINSSYTNLIISEEFGCDCADCKDSENLNYFKSETIKRALKKGKSSIECQTSFDNVEIGKLLGTYISQEQVRHVMHSPEDKLDKILVNTESLLIGQNEIKEKLDEQYSYLMQLPQNNTDLEEIKTAIEELGNQPEMIIEEITDKIIIGLSAFNNEMNEKLQEIYEGLQKTDDWQTKVKLSVPLLNLFGLNIETEIDVKNWSRKMYKKHGLKIFKLMGHL